MPAFPPNINLELIVLFPEINETQIKRRPAPKLAGQIKILGDVLTPVISDVIPTKVGIHHDRAAVDSRLRGNDKTYVISHESGNPGNSSQRRFPLTRE